MKKSIGFLVVALATSALSIPSTAGASTGLTSPSATLLPLNTIFVGPSTTYITLEGTGFGRYQCRQMVLKGVVTKNGSSGVAGYGQEQNSFATGCFYRESAVTVDNIKVESLTSSPTETGTGKLTMSYVAHFSSGLTCKYQLTNATATYTNNGDLLTLTKQPQTANAPCSPGGTFTASFTLETTAKSPILIMG